MPHRVAAVFRLQMLSASSHEMPPASKARASDLLTPLPDVREELGRRSVDLRLRARVSEYLSGDLPHYLGPDPVLCLARHLATPNFEALHFAKLAAALGIRSVIGEDTQDRFVAGNPLKRSLGKLPVYWTPAGDAQPGSRFEYATIIDFNRAAGRPLGEIATVWGEPLAAFHRQLCRDLLPPTVPIADDAEWISRNARGDLLEHYKRFLSLFVAHGVLFEDYLEDDPGERRFIEEVLRPACAHVRKTFGCRPLITRLCPPETAENAFWLGYPLEVRGLIEDRMNGLRRR